MSDPNRNPAADLPDRARLRSGTAARLAGLPVATLRVWERRYGVVAGLKSPSGQRLYTAQDVQRLTALRQLTEQGHGIGTIAALALPELQALQAPARAAADPGPARTLWVVGRAAAHRLRHAPGSTLLQVHDDLDAALAGTPCSADAVLVQLASLQPADLPRLAALHRAAGAHARLVVLYAFGAESLADALRQAGSTVQREPASGRDLARLLGLPAPAVAAAPAAAMPAPRRFGDEALAALAELPTRVACECPRHIAELVMQLAGFERYSADCGARSPADAALHRQLSALAGHARAQFETALADVMRAEGITLPA